MYLLLVWTVLSLHCGSCDVPCCEAVLLSDSVKILAVYVYISVCKSDCMKYWTCGWVVNLPGVSGDHLAPLNRTKSAVSQGDGLLCVVLTPLCLWKGHRGFTAAGGGSESFPNENTQEGSTVRQPLQRPRGIKVSTLSLFSRLWPKKEFQTDSLEFA